MSKLKVGIAGAGSALRQANRLRRRQEAVDDRSLPGKDAEGERAPID